MVAGMDASLPTNRTRTRAFAVLAAGTLLLAACGGGDDEPEATDDAGELATPAGEQDESTDDAGDGDGEVVEGVAISHLPFDVEAPSGFRMVPAECAADDDSADSDDEETEYQSPITYAVPEDWASSGRSSGGSGGILGTDVDLSFDTGSGAGVNVDMEWDSRTADGEIADWEGEPWTTFDYDSQVGDSTARIEFEKVATITVDEQEIDLFYRDPAQAPDHVSGEEYRARVAVVDLTAPFETGGVNEYTMVITIEFPSDAADVDQDTVETLLETLSMPTCVWDELLIDEETFRNVDLNGDGEIRSQEDAIAEMQEQFESLRQEHETG